MSTESRSKVLADARAAAVKSTPARERLALLFDGDSFVELDAFAKVGEEGAGVVTGYGAIDGNPVFAFAQDIQATGGAVGKIHAAKVKKVYDLAEKTGAPVVGIFDSNGARLSEGNDALAAYGDMLQSSSNISGVVPQISLILGTCAGTAAMIACNADFVVMSEKAEFFLSAAGIDGTEGAGSAANAAKSGAAHLVLPTEEEAIGAARNLISLLPLNNLSASPVCDFSANDAAAALSAACENMAEADTLASVEGVFDAGSVVEIQKEFGAGSIAALATLGGFTCGVVATKGGKLSAADCAKMARLVSICDAYQIPVVTFVNTEGFEANGETELAGAIRESAKLAHVYAQATCVKVSVITGAAYGSAYIALAGTNAGADVTLAWPSAVISALEPKAAVAFAHGGEITADHDRAAVEKEDMETTASALTAAADGYIEDVIDPAATRDVLLSTLDMLAGKRVTHLPRKHSNMPM